MAIEHTPLGLTNQNLLALQDTGINVAYRRIVDGDAQYVVEVEDTSDETDIQQSLRQKLLKDYWFLDPDIRKEGLKQRFGIRLDENVEVEVYNFQQNFGEEHLTQIASTLARYYQALKDKSLWNLKSIQIRTSDTLNGKSGQLLHGLEFPKQQRFELFPATFEQGKYRGTLNCNWVDGSVVHETTHVVLEGLLSQLWRQHHKKLGWESLENQLLVLPGGNTTAYYNKDYQELPTDYAGFQPDDDRAESVIAFLFDPTYLNVSRQTIISEVLNVPGSTNPVFQIIEKQAQLPELSEITIKVKKPEPIVSEMEKTKINPDPNPPIPLEEYRRRNAQQ